MTTNVDTYFAEGCGRCPLGGTPQCKVHTWQAELTLLRQYVLDTGLQEECKWGMPCYTFQGKNIAMIAAFKDSCTLSFFKGALLQDEFGWLQSAGENAQVAKLLRFTSVEQVAQAAEPIQHYLYQAIEVERAGLKVLPSSAPPLPEELQERFAADPALRQAFDALTPGRQRGYLLYFSAAKQSATRIARIEKCAPKIFMGQGMQD